MKKIFNYAFLLGIILLIVPFESFAQQRITDRGTPNFRKVGVHRGNQVRTVFSNYGVIAQPGSQKDLEVPGDMMPMVMSVTYLLWLV